MQSLQTKPNIISLTPKNSYKLILTSAYSSLGNYWILAKVYSLPAKIL